MLLIKIKQFFHAKRFFASLALAALFFVSQHSPIHAQAVTQGYQSDQPIQRGMIVALKKDDPTKVELLSQDSIDKMHGVAVNANDAPVTISTSGEKVFVATVGKYEVLVSSQGGDIEPGDYITISSINGIGMQENGLQELVLGKAAGTFNKDSTILSTSTIKDSKGQESKVNIGRVMVELGIARNPNARTDAAVPGFLKKASETIAGKQVSIGRIYASIAVFGICALIAGSILYAGVRSAIVSIGRNPLGKKIIVKGLFQVIITSFIIFILGLIAVYLLLRL